MLKILIGNIQPPWNYSFEKFADCCKRMTSVYSKGIICAAIKIHNKLTK